MTKKEKKLYNSITLGIIVGLIAPIITVYIFYSFQNNFYGDFGQYVKTIIQMKIITKVLSLSVLGNLAVFYLFIQTKRYFSARGVIISTLIYAIIMAIFMFVL